MAMAALGLTTHLSALKKAGARPLLMALILFIWLIVGGGAINLVIHRVMAHVHTISSMADILRMM